MNNRQYKESISFSFLNRSYISAAALFLLFSFGPAYAEDTDPFQLETAHWMSFDRYKEHAKTAVPAVEETAKTDKDTNAADDNGHFIDGTAEAPINVPSIPVVAAPTRPLNPPLMPGMNKGYNVQVNSTEDERPPLAQITHIDTEPTVQLPEKNWQKASEVARAPSKESENGGDADDDHTPLDIRMSFLPNTRITPIPSPEPKTNHGRRPAQAAVLAAAKAPEPKKSPAELAACASIDAYKKRQLDAIESDRQTLTALQAAIAQLGLQQQLSFMTNTPANTTTQANATPAALDISAPSLARPAKN